MGSLGGLGSPCGACKFLRRRCTSECIFAPYFSNEHGGAVQFAAIHKVFGASNASKMLLQVAEHVRSEAAVSIVYEAQARLHDPIYGCVAQIFSLQQQVASLQAQLMQTRAQLARSSSLEINQQCQGNYNHDMMQSYNNMYNINASDGSKSPRSSLDCGIDNNSTGELCFEDNFCEHLLSEAQILNKKGRRAITHVVDNELHALASRIMRS